MKRLILTILALAGLGGAAHAAPWQDESGISTNGITTCAKPGGPDLGNLLWSCWGDNSYGQIGNGNTASIAVPALVHTNFTQMSVGRFHSCGITAFGALYCWGRNDFGQVGNGTAGGSILSPVAVISGLTWAHVSVGGYHTCGVTTGGFALCWGAGGNGQIGVGSTANQLTPRAISWGSPMWKLASGWAHTCSIEDSSKALRCWGHNYYGQIGNKSNADATYPTGPKTASGAPAMTSGVTDVAGGWYSTCAIKNGALFCWGVNATGQLGDGPAASPWVRDYVASTAVAVGSPFTARNVKMSAETVCARAFDNSVGHDRLYCWGNNQKAQAHGGKLAPGPGGGSTAPYYTEPKKWPQNATNPSFPMTTPYHPMPAIHFGGGAFGYAVGHEHTCAWWAAPSSFAEPWCSGGNDFGQRGAGPIAASPSAYRIQL